MSTTTIDLSELGTPVDVSAISAGLKQLWEANETATRASLMNLVVYSDARDSLLANTHLVNALTLEHACRVLLVEAHTDGDPTIDAWIRAHCSLGPDGRKAVCCEQVAFQLGDSTAARLHNIVFANLESDLPLILWWQASLAEPFNQRLYRRIDRLFLDSQAWSDPTAEFAALREASRDRNKRFVIHDLNWTRSFHLRLAIAASFEDPQDLQALQALEDVHIAYHPEYRSTAALLGGWIQQRLTNDTPIVLEETAGTCGAIHGLTFRTASKAFHLGPADDCDYYQLQVQGDARQPRLFPIDHNNLSQLLIDQLGRGGNNAAYFQVIDRALALL